MRQFVAFTHEISQIKHSHSFKSAISGIIFKIGITLKINLLN